MSRLREFLALVLIALLPFHAFFVTVMTRYLQGPGHAPMANIAIWKEGLLAVILLAAVGEVILGWRNGKWKMVNGKYDVVDGLILLLLILAFLIPSQNFALGFKYDFVPLVAFLILRRVPWSDWFKETVQSVVLIVGAIVAAYGILTFFLSEGFFTWLGYSAGHSLYLPDGPLAAFQQISDSSIRRIQSTMSGPNQLGIWLLIPLSVWLSSRVKNGKLKMENGKYIFNFQFSIFNFSLLVGALVLTFSRSAWIGAFAIASVAAARAMPQKRFLTIGGSAVGLLAVGVISLSLLHPAVFIRKTSLIGHIERPIQAFKLMVAHPFGLGLGSAGPASNRSSDPCVFLEDGADASWAKGSPDLCVFVGKTQAQPLGRVCNCPVLPENWYLQIGVELGIIGFILYVMLIVVILRRIGMENGKWKMVNTFSIFNFQFSIFLGISIAALFLHAWEDAAVAYTGWLLVAAAFSRADPDVVRSRQN